MNTKPQQMFLAVSGETLADCLSGMMESISQVAQQKQTVLIESWQVVTLPKSNIINPSNKENFSMICLILFEEKQTKPLMAGA
jgi:hypothetical protein